MARFFLTVAGLGPFGAQTIEERIQQALFEEKLGTILGVVGILVIAAGLVWEICRDRKKKAKKKALRDQANTSNPSDSMPAGP
jgi:hypothetical protein